MKFQKIANEIFTVDQFMTTQECADWITFSEAQGYEDRSPLLCSDLSYIPRGRGSYAPRRA